VILQHHVASGHTVNSDCLTRQQSLLLRS